MDGKSIIKEVHMAYGTIFLWNYTINHSQIGHCYYSHDLAKSFEISLFLTQGYCVTSKDTSKIYHEMEFALVFSSLL